ncbi:Osmotin, thaumatin-like protein [Rhizopus microsporus var. microsporus]|uniref:Osmotin, thaumatin-like protein n=2 Tax=Rhizopus microsporus TaxID=58291 RepID=A0A2G4T3L1_RHIZD|nr:Osmotin, thaumatin-like protein [Rhizopus microsporus ATCC 52813]ORE04089.1 Osmotin, thaumatin-like protein [Rhizopus microsporus var. microsporus]PHZ15602.1 Osmotin, thaumatin-like protein [Rhizopus microsporus ATCC 52813]
MYKLVSILCFLVYTLAAGKTITVKNNCKKVVSVGTLTNGKGSALPEKTADLPPGGSTQFTESDTWGGRVWGRYQCSGSSSNDATACGNPGAVNPATLAEFLFKGSNGQDYYDISLVDGYNLQMTISPDGGSPSSGYSCGSPQCVTPDCPDEFAVKDGTGNTIACKSACSATGKPEDCCTGPYNSPDACKAGAAANSIKSSCPDAYSFAYDDQTSTFSCSATGYTVTLC